LINLILKQSWKVA